MYEIDSRYCLHWGRLKRFFLSQAISISDDKVLLEQTGMRKKFTNDQVFVFAGGELPTDFLKKIGVSVETRFGTR